MINKDIEQALNAQINQEFTAAYSYLAMSTWCEENNLSGFASWFMLQHDEEIEHGMKLYHYLLNRGGHVQLEAIAKPSFNCGSVLDLFKTGLSMEQDNTKSINKLYALATDANDYATKSHLQWFLDEQVEEESSFEEAIGLVELAGDDSSALLMLNEKFGSRKPEAD